jgi:non-lysosomal glucosylceramidase
MAIDGNVGRRGFLALSVGGLAGLVAGLPGRATAGPVVVPADKGLSAADYRALAERGEPTVYRGDALARIGMPVGGITAGQLYLGGDGRLWWWDIDNPPAPPVAGLDFAGNHYAAPVSYLDPATYKPRFRQGFAIRVGGETRSLDSDGFDAGGITFTGRYPVGRVSYPANGLPVDVTLEAFSPFVPLSVDDSSLPATLLRYTVRNTSHRTVRAVLAGWSESPVALDGRTQQPLRLRSTAFGGAGVEFSAASGEVTDPRPDIVFEDFESGTYDGWTVTGTAFGDSPVTEAELPDYMKRFGPVGVHGTYFVTSHDFRSSGGDAGRADQATGTLTSPPFTLSRRYVRVRVGGGEAPGAACVNVLVDGQVVGSATGADTEVLALRAIDVARWAGRTATIQVVDTATGGWGHVNVDEIVFTDVPPDPVPLDELPDNGTFALAALDRRAVAVPSLAAAGTLDDVFDAGAGPTDVDGSLATVTGAVRVPVTLRPGESSTVTFAVGWHFPVPRRSRFASLVGAATLRHHYATRFGAARDVVGHLAARLTELAGATERWASTWYDDSTLPHWLLERLLAPVTTLATTACYRFDDGRFYAYEGVYCCDGTCEHVWNYAQGVARLFPALERDTRQRVDLGIAFHADTGAMDYRAEYDRRVAMDGQAGTVLRIYREHQMAPDASFLTANWARIKLAVGYLIGADGDGNGIIEGAQYNTLDQTWYGEIPWISGLYVAALRAGQAMAAEVGDTAFADRCRTLAAAGTSYLTNELWNGTEDYFIQRLDPAHTATNSNTGCYADQLYGQTYADQLGLPRVFPADRARTALANLYRYNFLPDPVGYRDGSPIGDIGRVFATTDEPGLLVCTWPFGEGADPAGGGVTSSVAYFNEVWTGLEYQAAAGMLGAGLTGEALAVLHAIHRRYGADRRNPYNEIECSDHYSRAMMSHAVHLAAQGYEHHGPRGHLGFAPVIGPEDFRAAFTTAEGWGSYRQHRHGNHQRAEVELRYGRLRLATLAFTTPEQARAVTVRLAGHPVSSRLTTAGLRADITLDRAVTVQAGQTLAVELAF